MSAETRVPSYVIELNRDIDKLNNAQKDIETRLQELEIAHNELIESIPSTAILSKSVVTRAFAIWGHTLLVSVIFYGIFIVLTVALAIGSN